jgi:predicted glycosyltransferase
VGKQDMGNFIELEKKYRLIFNSNDPEKAIAIAMELIRKSGLKDEWKKKRDKLLADKIDTTHFLVYFIGNYPESLKKIQNVHKKTVGTRVIQSGDLW